MLIRILLTPKFIDAVTAGGGRQHWPWKRRSPDQCWRPRAMYS